MTFFLDTNVIIDLLNGSSNVLADVPRFSSTSSILPPLAVAVKAAR